MTRKLTRNSLRHLQMEQLQQSPKPHEHEQKPEHEPQEQGMAMATSPPLVPTADPGDQDHAVHENDPDNSSLISNTSKKTAGRKKKPFRKRAAAEEKTVLLREKLQPIAFVPNKPIDFSKYEKVFMRLGLWEFAHLELDREIRLDLLASFIINYDRCNRRSVVKDSKIKVSRPDFARALKIPLKNDKHRAETLDPDSVSEGFNEESLAVVNDFVSHWFILHEDAWIIPDEIVTAERLLKHGELHKVDWPKLIWVMAEKELSQGPALETCFYASHFQCLMRSQKPELFEEEEEQEKRAKFSIDEVDGSTKTRALEDLQGQDEEKHTELSIVLEKPCSPLNEGAHRVGDEEEEMNVEDCMERCPCFLDGKNDEAELPAANLPDHCFRHCNMNESGTQDIEHENKPVDYNSSSKVPHLEKLTSADLMSAMENNIPFSPSVPLIDPASGELYLSRGVNRNHILNPGSSTFCRSFKREFDVHLSHTDHLKKMRNDGHWESMNFDTCVEDIQNLLGKTRMMHMEKEQSLVSAQLQIHQLAEEIQSRDYIILALERTKCEEQRKMNAELQHARLELYVTTNLLQGYKRAFEETRQAFSEYRKQSQQHDEPLYKDFGESGGLVLSQTDFTKQLLEKEREERIRCRCSIENEFNSFERDWGSQFEEFHNKVSSLTIRLLAFEEEVKTLKARYENSKKSKT